MQFSDDALPPVVTCARCRKPECSGCEPAPAQVDVASIAWEGSLGFSKRLWKTSLDTSTDPETTFGHLCDGKLTSAIAFAVIAEALAIGSLALFALLAACTWAPSFVHTVLIDSEARWLGVAAFLAAVAALVAMHAVWGLCLEAGAALGRSQPRWRLGVRFGLYACGWDLLTSPAGIVHGLVTRGPKRALGPIGNATRAARPAMHAYMVRNRKFDAPTRRRSTVIAWSVLGTVLLLVSIGALTFAIRVAIGRG